eukprot:3591026-Amphidinium_carterae.1
MGINSSPSWKTVGNEWLCNYLKVPGMTRNSLRQLVMEKGEASDFCLATLGPVYLALCPKNGKM